MSFVDLKTSILVNRQVPEFVRDEYPTFVTFLEAYYQFLEGTANTGTTANNLVTTSKNLRDIRDVDSSLENFQTNFYNTYASLIPLDVQANKELLFKHLVSLYKSKGSDSSFKLLFQLLFGVDIDLVLPKNNVLKASSSKWQIDNKLRINQDIASVYTGDGVTKTFTLAQIVSADDISVFVNGVLQDATFFINREYRKLNFITAPTNNSIIRVVYNNFDADLLNNRKVIGIKSGASAIIEQANRRIISDTLNLGLPIELLINTNSLDGNFLNGEFVTIPIINPDDPYGNTITIQASTFSIVKQFNIIDGGFNYQVGDPVLVTGGNASANAVGTVSSIFRGLIETVSVSSGGATFANLSPVTVTGNGGVTLTITVDGIDQSGINAANSFIVVSDVIASFNGNTNSVNTLISSANYAFANSITVTSPNLNTRIVDVLGFQTLAVGPITNVKVLLTSGATPTTPGLDAFGAPYGPLAALRSPKSLRSVGRIKVNNAGSGYAIGDEILFGINPPGTYGQAAAATVEAINGTGGVVTIGMANTRIVGTATITSSSVSVGGSGTKFLTDLRVGDKIDINNESRIVSSISDNTTLSVTTPFTYSASSKKIGVFGRNPKGGHSYTQNNFPSVTISSTGGIGANIQIDSLVSDGESMFPSGVGQPGKILSIQVLNPGSGYEYIPIVTITGGSGTASANADIERSYLSSPGRWITSDSIISSTERKLAGQDYYVDYSYVISSQVEFYRYKQILKNLLHPVGFVNYAEFNKLNTIDLTDVSVNTINVATDGQFLTISGTVNVGNGRITVTGTNTKFNAAVSRGAITAGSRIAVNGEIRTVNSVVSNTSLLVSSNVNDIWIANAGSSYSNGFLLFANGGGTITSLSIQNTGSGYENGDVVLSSADEAIPAVATVVANGTGHLQSVTLVSGGLYSNKPIALPSSDSHKVLYANSITITNPGAGYANGFLDFTGGAPLRAANVSVEVYNSNGAIRTLTVNDSGLYESNPTSATPNTSANVVIANVFSSTINVGGAHSNGIIIFSGGGTANRSAQVAVEVYSSNGAVRKYTILDSGLYSSTPTAVLNTTPVSIATVAANTVTYNGVALANGNLVFTGGNPVIDATGTYEVHAANGVIRRITITNVGLYRTTPTVTTNTVATSITEVFATDGGSGYVNGYITFTGGGANSVANVSAVVNATGAIIRTVINRTGLYANGNNITVLNVINPATGLAQSPSIPASFRISYNANTSNAANLIATTSSNTRYTANVTITANSNVVTNATFTMSGVSNTETLAVINVGFTGTNTAAQSSIEVYPSNGAIRRVSISSQGNYFYAPDITPNSGGTGAVIKVNSVGTFSQTANGQEMIIWK
jgi:hypothetical protein